MIELIYKDIDNNGDLQPCYWMMFWIAPTGILWTQMGNGGCKARLTSSIQVDNVKEQHMHLPLYGNKTRSAYCKPKKTYVSKNIL